MILVAAGLILFTAIERLLHPQPLQRGVGLFAGQPEPSPQRGLNGLTGPAQVDRAQREAGQLRAVGGEGLGQPLLQLLLQLLPLPRVERIEGDVRLSQGNRQRSPHVVTHGRPIARRAESIVHEPQLVAHQAKPHGVPDLGLGAVAQHHLQRRSAGLGRLFTTGSELARYDNSTTG